MKINENFLNLKENYLFSTMRNKINDFETKNPSKKIIKLGIGDVTNPLCDVVIKEIHKVTDEMSKKETFKGYGPERGYEFLRERIQNYYYKRNVRLSLDEIFIGDGAKSDISNILDLFDRNNKVLIPNPVYPVYLDTNIISGREIIYLDLNKTNDFLPLPDSKIHADIIYLCSPNNPTGAVYDKNGLKSWVKYAIDKGAVILFDAAYEAFISDSNLPRSIFEIDGAQKCAIEFCSLSKTAGFTGTRCGYTIIPESLKFNGIKLNDLWFRRQTTKFNGVAYIIQKAAASVFTDKGLQQINFTIDYYKENAKLISNMMKELGIWFTGGENSPYIWFKCPKEMSSWRFFDYLLEEANVVGTPGSGFGKNGEGFFRLTAFCERKDIIEAINRIKSVL